MSDNIRTTRDVINEKYEDRGWNIDSMLDREVSFQKSEIAPLPLSYEEYQTFSNLLAKLALQEEDQNLCDLYFNLKRRSFYGNGYSQPDNIESIERDLWTIGTGEKIENSKKHL